MFTFTRGMELFLRSEAPRLVFSDYLSTEEFCPLPLFPSLRSGPWVSPIDKQ